MNSEVYWNRFADSGNIQDYLEYRGMETGRQTWEHMDGADDTADKNEQTGDIGESISYGDWYGVVRNTYRGI